MVKNKSNPNWLFIKQKIFMKKITPLLFILISLNCFSQIKGTVTDVKGNPLAFVNIFEENTYNSTTSNEQGKFELNII